MKNTYRQYSIWDKVCLGLDMALKTLSAKPTDATRPYPAKHMTEPCLSVTERKHVAGLMRVNHAGEVSAQALYFGQGLVSRNPLIRDQMQQAALEEIDHLAWCQKRLIELGSHSSYLNPFWYVGSLAIGVTAGLIGDKWSLGFVAETETQVVEHLKNHLHSLPADDKKTAAILEQMQIDESQHHDQAVQAGAATLPQPIKQLMGLFSKCMVNTAYRF